MGVRAIHFNEKGAGLELNLYLLAQAHLRQLSGVELKDETGGGTELLAGAAKNFLL
jgi:hypothetical protein